MTPRRAIRRRPRGYTVIEVMLAISLLAIASAGILALHSVSAMGNMRTRDLAVGTQIAETWVERLRSDAASWTLPSPSYPNQPSNLDNTIWLKVVNTSPGVWLRPMDVANRGSAAFDLLGNDVEPGSTAVPVYCTNVRLTWLFPPPVAGTNATGTPLVRADVRVFWRREHGPDALFKDICDPANDYSVFDTALAMNTPYERYHFVYLSTTIAENVAP